jgi:hypothetical protein
MSQEAVLAFWKGVSGNISDSSPWPELWLHSES